jgi:hypothetical protein
MIPDAVEGRASSGARRAPFIAGAPSFDNGAMTRSDSAAGFTQTPEKSAPDWFVELRQAAQAAEEATEATTVITNWLWSHVAGADVFPPNLPEELRSSLDALGTALRELTDGIGEGLDRVLWRPFGKLLNGRLLSREEYYLIRAMGVDFGVVVSESDDYEQFRMLHVQTKEESFYINFGGAPRDPSSHRVAARFGKPPEEVDVSDLRPAQRRFFQKHRSDHYARFQRRAR